MPTDKTTTADTPEAISFLQACSLRGMLKLRLAGLKGRGRVRDIVDTVSKITGKQYTTSRAGQQKALDDLTAWIEAQKESTRG